MSKGYLAAPALLVQIHGVLDGLAYTAHPETGVTPSVWWYGTDADRRDEQIELTGLVDPTDNEWYAGRAVQEETNVFEVVVRSEVACGYSYPEALARVDALARIVQDGFQDSTGIPTGLTTETGMLVKRNYRWATADLRTIVLADHGWGCTMALHLRVQTTR